MRQSNQWLLIAGTRGKLLEPIEESHARARRPELSAFDAEILDDLLDGRIADVVYQLERAKPRERIRRIERDAQE